MKIIKKDGLLEDWNNDKIVNAILKASERINYEISTNQALSIAENCKNKVKNKTPTSKLHSIVIKTLEEMGYSEISEAYQEFRDYKNTYAKSWEQLKHDADTIIFLGDRENANFDSSLISTKGSLIKGSLTKELYQQFYLSHQEKFLTKRGDIYIHDLRDMIFGSVNCFAEETKFITSKGLKSFKDFNDGDKVEVPTHLGNWKTATVHCYGKQKLNKIGFKRSRGNTVYVYATSNHRWILKDNKETTNLKVNDILCETPRLNDFKWESLSKSEKTFWCLGFLFGDGTQSHSSACTIRLCQEKSKYAQRFEECGFTVSVPNNKGWNGDPIVCMHDTSKSFPPVEFMSRNEIKLFINGLLCADGGKDFRSNQRDFRSLQVSGMFSNLIYSLLHTAGYFVSSERDLSFQETNFGLRRNEAKSFQLFENTKERTLYRVVSIDETERFENVWCLDVEDDHSFILENGIPTGNCCLFDIGNVLKNGFEMSSVKYSEPRTVLSALQVIGDITLVATAQQFGGFTLAEIDKVLLPYVKKSFNLNCSKFAELTNDTQKIEEFAIKETKRELEQGFQSLELKLNTVPCSRGDFAFTTLTFGQFDTNLNNQDKFWLKTIGETILNVRKKGHNGFMVVFPKLVYLYDSEQIKNDRYSQELFDKAVETSSTCMYPDYLSLNGSPEVNKVAQEFLKTRQIVSPMGCRAYLSHYEDENGARTIGRCNIGAVSLNIPVIMTVTKREYEKDWKEMFWVVLESRLETIRNFLKKRYDIIRHTKASTNPLAFTQGGFYKGNLKPNDEIGDLVKYMTASFGITALNESTVLWNGKTIYEDKSQFANKVVDFILEKIEKFKKEDGYLYALYGTPAESLCSKQAQQYKNLTGDNQFGEYFSNSFHCHVSEHITPIEKQDAEFELFHKVNGGHIQYVRIENPENIVALKSIIERGMEMGFYQGVNFERTKCNKCGCTSYNSSLKCKNCGSTNISTISRVCGYLGYSNLNGQTRMNDGKMCEIKDRVSM